MILPRLNKYIIKKPTPKQLALLYLNNYLEVFYGGAAGGAKSIGLLMAALQYVDMPGYSAILFRRTFKDLSLAEALIPVSQEWLTGTDAHWDGLNYQWKFPSGATLAFGYLAAEKDKYRYKGAAFQFVGFDELTQFSLTQYLYLFSRARRPRTDDSFSKAIPIRIRSASNPGEEGHYWVKERFMGENALKEGRVFLPSRIEDNPHLDEDEYIKTLSVLDKLTYKQLREGDWEARPSGKIIKREWLIKNIVDNPPDSYDSVVRYYDPAWRIKAVNDHTATCKMGIKDGVYYILDVKWWKLDIPSNKEKIKEYAKLDGSNVSIGLEDNSAQAVLVADLQMAPELSQYAIQGITSINDKLTRAAKWVLRAKEGVVKMVRADWNLPFLDVCDNFDKDSDFDDPIDAVSGAYAMLEAGDQFYVGVV